MRIQFAKYHALGNDFIVIERPRAGMTRTRISRLTEAICERRSGVGADGVIYLSPTRGTDGKVDIFNADGGWAEKSGNGLRIAAVHLRRRTSRKKQFVFRTGAGDDPVVLGQKIAGGFIATCGLGKPDFLATKVPVKTRLKHVINTSIKIGPAKLPMTCLSVGNPHAVLVVDNFDFDWMQLGADIETAPVFPNGANVEFVRMVSRKKLRVAEWERGAGPTGSSGTGAAAAACAMVMLGLANRECQVEFERGALSVHWDEQSNIVHITGPAQFVAEGRFEL